MLVCKTLNCGGPGTLNTGPLSCSRTCPFTELAAKIEMQTMRSNDFIESKKFFIKQVIWFYLLFSGFSASSLDCLKKEYSFLRINDKSTINYNTK